MKNLFYLSLVLLGITSCSVDHEEKQTNDALSVFNLSVVNDPVTQSFGPAGYVTVYNDAETLYVKFVANQGHKLINSRLDIVANPADFLDTNGGNLPPGKMGSFENQGGVSEYIYEFPLSDFPESCIYIAPWAIFTAGGPDTQHYAGDILGGNDHHELWWYFKYGECALDDEVVVCDSAYMLSNPETTLNSYYHEKSNVNWGWYQYYDTAVFGSSEVFEIWAGAGLNDLDKGFQIGTVTVSVDANGIVTAIPTWFYTSISNDIHVYVGETLPVKRPAPGKFVNSGDTNKDGKFYIIFHTKSCWATL
ncbi:hypothetical protein C7S20_16920 [Christiangramia fulva]|uniref:Uncharacterized protein n=1 Tax=Christiangramia fulva TaxID=2126553 RepID=A0A2R3Z987_9FLAO|nr:hypothetical protein [Christiangramia fulva]AVR46807.1 hypothetical protein C7S20_16920 [Christiangramia fulva]